MRYFAILLMLLMPGAGYTETLAAVNDAKLTEILSNFSVLAETPQTSTLFARVLRVQAPGECDGSASTCPKSTLYIAVSTADEYPIQKLYQLPEGYNWAFIGWEELPEDRNQPKNVVLKVKVQKPSKAGEKTCWIDETFLVTVNEQAGSWLNY